MKDQHSWMASQMLRRIGTFAAYIILITVQSCWLFDLFSSLPGGFAFAHCMASPAIEHVGDDRR